MLDAGPLLAVISRVCIIRRDAAGLVFDLLRQHQVEKQRQESRDRETSPKLKVSQCVSRMEGTVCKVL